MAKRGACGYWLQEQSSRWKYLKLSLAHQCPWTQVASDSKTGSVGPQICIAKRKRNLKNLARLAVSGMQKKFNKIPRKPNWTSSFKARNPRMKNLPFIFVTTLQRNAPKKIPERTPLPHSLAPLAPAPAPILPAPRGKGAPLARAGLHKPSPRIRLRSPPPPKPHLLPVSKPPSPEAIASSARRRRRRSPEGRWRT